MCFISEVTFVPVSKVTGQAEVEEVLAAVRPTTCLVTIMLANNETGVIMVSQPFLFKEALGKKALDRGIPVSPSLSSVALFCPPQLLSFTLSPSNQKHTFVQLLSSLPTSACP